MMYILILTMVLISASALQAEEAVKPPRPPQSFIDELERDKKKQAKPSTTLPPKEVAIKPEPILTPREAHKQQWDIDIGYLTPLRFKTANEIGRLPHNRYTVANVIDDDKMIIVDTKGIATLLTYYPTKNLVNNATVDFSHCNLKFEYTGTKRVNNITIYVVEAIDEQDDFEYQELLKKEAAEKAAKQAQIKQ